MQTEIPMLTVPGIQLHGGYGHPCGIRFNQVQDLHRLCRHVSLPLPLFPLLPRKLLNPH